MARSMEGLLGLVALDAASLSAASRRLAAFSLFDWMTVALAGSDQPLCDIVRAQTLAERGT